MIRSMLLYKHLLIFIYQSFISAPPSSPVPPSSSVCTSVFCSELCTSMSISSATTIASPACGTSWALRPLTNSRCNVTASAVAHFKSSIFHVWTLGPVLLFHLCCYLMLSHYQCKVKISSHYFPAFWAWKHPQNTFPWVLAWFPICNPMYCFQYSLPVFTKAVTSPNHV